MNKQEIKQLAKEKQHPKFNIGDKVVAIRNDYHLKDVVGGVCEITEITPVGYHIKSLTGEWFATDDDLAPYTEPEAKDESSSPTLTRISVAYDRDDKIVFDEWKVKLTPSDRNKCLKEIESIIKQYS